MRNLLMDMKSPTNADFVKEYLREQTKFDLYPEEEKDDFYDKLQEEYDMMYRTEDMKTQYREFRNNFLEDTKFDLLTLGLCTAFVEPVLESMYATSREYDVAYTSMESFVQEQGVENLINQFKYQSNELSQLAYFVENTYKDIVESIDYKIKEGLPEDKCYEIENNDIKKFIVDCKSCCPKDITNKISKRVEDAVNDFIDEKKQTQFKIQKIYQTAKQKVEELNQAHQSFDSLQQTDTASDGMDPEVGIDNNLNSKLDMQQQQDIANINDPSMQPPPNAASGGMGMSNMSPAQEAMAWAKNQEAQLLENNYSVFDGMVRILIESTYKNDVLRETYSNDKGKVDLKKIINDVRAMYTVLETCNVLNLIELTESYLETMLKEMHDSIK